MSTTDLKEFLLAWLESERRHVLAACEGLSDEQMRQTILPSGWSCNTMLKHLALSDEHYWFSCIVGGAPLDFFDTDALRDNGEWRADPDDTGDAMRELYRAECATSNEVIARVDLDSPPVCRDAWWGEWDPGDVLHIMTHVISETATHAGHLDAHRELIDGHQHIVL